MEKTRIKLTLGQIAATDSSGRHIFMEALRKLRQQPLGKEAYAVGKSIRIIEEEFADHKEAYAAIVKIHGQEEPAGSGNWRVTDPAKLEKANAEIKELQAKEFEIYLDHPIKLPDVNPAGECLSNLAEALMLAAKVKPEDALQTAQMLSALVKEWWAMVLTPEDTMQLDALITE